MCEVVNKYRSEFDVYIGRGSMWGNPFKMEDNSDAERRRVVLNYKLFLWGKIKSGEITEDQLIGLRGKRLGCFCAPKLCHGNVIQSAVEWAYKNKKRGYSHGYPSPI